MSIFTKSCASGRLEREILKLKKNPPPGISCSPKDDSQKNILLASKYFKYYNM